MSTLKEILDKLPKADRDLLNYAFEHEIAQFVSLPDRRFIGVNLGYMSHLVPEISVGVWSMGLDMSIKKDSK